MKSIQVVIVIAPRGKLFMAVWLGTFVNKGARKVGILNVRPHVALHQAGFSANSAFVTKIELLHVAPEINGV